MTRFEKICIKCKTPFEVTSKNKHKKFCCRSCANSYTTSQRYTEDESLYKDGLNSFNMYVMGLVFSDGCLSYDKHSKRFRITIALNDKEIIQAIHDVWTPKKSVYSYKNSYSLVTNNAYDIEFLRKYGITERKSLSLKFPTNMIPKMFLGDFIRGFFDGDGSVYVNKTTSNGNVYYYTNVSFTSGSLVFLQQLQQILQEAFDIKSVINKDCRKDTWYLKIRIQSELKKIYNLMYSNDGLCMKRKKEKFNL